MRSNQRNGGVNNEMHDPDKDCKAMIATLERLCEQRGISQYSLAKKARISTSTLSYIMKGKTKPYLYTVLELCNVLGIRIEELFYEGNDMQNRMACMTGEEEKILMCYRCFSDQKRQLLKIYMKMLQQYDGELFEKAANK